MFCRIKKTLELFTSRERWQILGLLLSIFLMAIFQTLGVASILPFMSLVMHPELALENEWIYYLYTILHFSNTINFIFFVGVLMLGIIIASNVVSAFATWLKFKFVWKKNHTLSKHLLKKYLWKPYAYFLNSHTGDLSKNVLTEVHLLTNQFLIPLLDLVTRSIILFFIFLMLIVVNPLITFIAIGLLGGPYVLFYIVVRKKLEMKGKKRLESNRLRFKTAHEAFGSIKILKLMGKEAYFLNKYSIPSEKHAQLMTSMSLIGNLPRFALEALAFGGIAFLVLYYIGSQKDAGNIIPMISFYAFAGYRLMPTLQMIFQSFTQIKFTQATLDKIHREITEEYTAHNEDNTSINPHFKLPYRRSLYLHNVNFRYPGAKDAAIRNVSLKIPYLNSVALVGATGSGKTTLVDIILGLLRPQEGYMTVDGVEVKEENIPRWQQNIGYVPQGIYLCDDTITRNIAFGIPDREIYAEAVKQAAKIANLYDFVINELPRGFDTFVGERGIRLSGGQRQRIGIARALYHDPEILILDEATSSLDGITENAVMQAMHNIAKVKTFIIITHRVNTVKNFDTIYLLDKGRIIARGTFQELIKSNTKFQALAKMNNRHPDEDDN